MKKGVLTLLLCGMLVFQINARVNANEINSIDDNEVSSEMLEDDFSMPSEGEEIGDEEDCGIDSEDNSSEAEDSADDNRDDSSSDDNDSKSSDERKSSKKSRYDEIEEDYEEFYDESEEYYEEFEDETEDSEEDSETDKRKLIIAFDELEDNTVTVDSSNKPSIDELTEMFPDTIRVEVSDGDESYKKEIKVSWYCVGDDYEESNGYYFQFSPVWNKSEYKLADGLSIEGDAPYISVRVKNTDNDNSHGNAGKVDKALVAWATAYDASSKEEDKELVYNYLVGTMGISNAAACGIMANIQYESGFSNIALGDGGTSYGLCQWHAGRFSRLRNYCEKHSLDYRTTEAQLKYLEYELKTTYTDVYNYIKHVENTKEGAYKAGYYWCVNYEKPSNAEVKAVTRGNLAKNALWKIYQDRFVVYRIEYELLEGSNAIDNPMAYSSLTDEIELKDAIREGYAFDGWYMDGDFSEEVTAITGELDGDVILYAKWRELTEEELYEAEDEEPEDYTDEESIIDYTLGINPDFKEFIYEDERILSDEDDEWDVLIGESETTFDYEDGDDIASESLSGRSDRGEIITEPTEEVRTREADSDEVCSKEKVNSEEISDSIEVIENGETEVIEEEIEKNVRRKKLQSNGRY